MERLRIAWKPRAWWGLAIGAGMVLVVILFAVGVTAPLAWAFGVVTAAAAGIVQKRLEKVLPAGCPLSVTTRVVAGNYVRIPQELGSRVVPRSGLHLDITMETGDAQAVILHDLRAVVVSREALPEAKVIPHAGVMEVRMFEVCLTDQPPRVLPVDGPGFPYKVTKSDPEMISVTARVHDAIVSWRLELVWSCNGREGVLPIDQQGTPFVTAGLADD